ncbi:MAG: GNAT family N-acetyltransferase [Marinifilaceae bacterium]
MMKVKKFSLNQKASLVERNQIINFLFENLEEYGDPIDEIEKCFEYAMEECKSFGGCIFASYEDEEIVGAVIINNTGMVGYIPEHILVYIASHKQHRGKGIGKLLMESAINETHGDIALHVEPDNPARFLYEKLGFKTKYNEMRLKKRI